MKSRMILFVVTFCCLVAAEKLVAYPGQEAGASKAPGTKEPVEVSFMVMSGMTDAVDEASPLMMRLREKVGIVPKISFVASDYFQKLSTLIASDSTPDVFFHGGIGGQDTAEQYYKLIKEGLIIAFSDYASKYPNLAKRLKSFEDLKAPQFGKLYSLPVMMSTKVLSPVSNPHTIWYRKDWLDKLKLRIPTDTIELYSVLKAFATQDPDGNGVKDTYGYTAQTPGLWWFYPIFNAFGSDIQRFEKKNGKWMPMNINPGAKEALVWLNRLYREGILDPEFMLNTYDKMMEKFVSGKVGAFLINAGDFYNGIYNTFKQAYPDKDPKPLFTWSPCLKDTNGVKRVNGFPNYWGMNCISAKSSESKRTKALEFFNYALSEEGHTLLTYGIEGIHYKVEGGRKVNINPDGADGNRKSMMQIDPAAFLKNIIQFDTDVPPDGTPNRKEIEESVYVWSEGAVADPLAYLFINPAIMDPVVKNSLWDITQTTWTKIIVESSNVAQDFDQYVKDWLSKGGQKLIDETNRAATAQGL